MLRVFISDTRGYPQWLASHPDGFVITVDQQFADEEWPRDPEGRIDFEAIPEVRLAADHVIRLPDGSAEYIGVPGSQSQTAPAVLHRARCETIKTLGDRFSKHCAPHAEFDDLMAAFAGQELHRDESCF